MTRPSRRKDDTDIAIRADELIRTLDDLVGRLEAILIGVTVAPDDPKD